MARRDSAVRAGWTTIQAQGGGRGRRQQRGDSVHVHEYAIAADDARYYYCPWTVNQLLLS